MKLTKRRVVSVEEVTAKLDALARRNGITSPCYEESEADSMSEFDALKWTSLCSQRIALQQREYQNAKRDWPMPPILRSLYGQRSGSISVNLENTDDGQFSLAA
jgi:phosphoketolase